MIRIERGDRPDLKIYVQRKRRSACGTRMLTKYEDEKERAIAHFNGPADLDNADEVKKSSFTFNVYRDRELKKHLTDLFNKKCAYCECSISVGATLDVEHFRPKKMITSGDLKLKPGYYWLAADWDNLLLACQYCNRTEKLEAYDQETPPVDGKGTHFPLKSGGQHVRFPDEDIAREEPYRLLLNPCCDHPEDEFRYTQKGEILAEIVGGQKSERAATSIKIYGLHRMDLTLARGRKIKSLRRNLKHLDLLLNEEIRLHREKATRASIDKNEQEIDETMSELKEMLSPSAQFLGYKRYWLRKQLDAGEFNIFAAFGIDLLELCSSQPK